MLKTKIKTGAVMTLVLSSLLSSSVFAAEVLPFTRNTEGTLVYGSNEDVTFDFTLHISDISSVDTDNRVTVWVESYDERLGENVVDKLDLPVIYVPSGTVFQVEYPDTAYTKEQFYSTTLTKDSPPSIFTEDYVIDGFDFIISDSENDVRLFDADKNSADKNGYLQYSVKEYLNDDMPFLLFAADMTVDTSFADDVIFEEMYYFFAVDEDVPAVNRTNYTFKNFNLTNSTNSTDLTEIYNSAKSFIKPQMIKGKSYLPLRALGEDILGGTVFYNTNTGLIEVTVDGKKLYFGEKTSKTNVPVESNFVTIKGKSYLPVRAVSEAFGLTVDYDAANDIVKILK